MCANLMNCALAKVVLQHVTTLEKFCQVCAVALLLWSCPNTWCMRMLSGNDRSFQQLHVWQSHGACNGQSGVAAGHHPGDVARCAVACCGLACAVMRNFARCAMIRHLL